MVCRLFQFFFVFIPGLKGIVAPKVIKQVQPSIYYFESFGINLYLLAAFPHRISTPPAVSRFEFVRTGFESGEVVS